MFVLCLRVRPRTVYNVFVIIRNSSFDFILTFFSYTHAKLIFTTITTINQTNKNVVFEAEIMMVSHLTYSLHSLCCFFVRKDIAEFDQLYFYHMNIHTVAGEGEGIRSGDGDHVLYGQRHL